MKKTASYKLTRNIQPFIDFGVKFPMIYNNLFSEEQIQTLLLNGQPSNSLKNNVPVAYLTVDNLGWKFLITEINVDNPNTAFGLVDYDTKLWLHYINLTELMEEVQSKNETINPEFDFYGEYPLAVYAMVAREFGTIVTDDLETDFHEELSKATTPLYTDTNQNINILRKEFMYML